MSENIQGACRRFPDSKSAMALSVCGEFELADHFPLVRFMETRERHRKHIDVILGDWNRLKKLLAKRNAQIKALKQVSK